MTRGPRLGALPLWVWTSLLCGGAVLLSLATAGAVLRAQGALSSSAAGALVAGALVGLVMTSLAVLAAARLAGSLRRLRSYAAHRPDEPADEAAGEPAYGDHGPAPLRELADLVKVLDALHLRVRVAEELGERHRREALTTGAGVFELVSGLVAAEEGARGQLAAELHDTVAQSLMIASGLLAAGPTRP